MNYIKTLRVILFLALGINFLMFSFGYLRASIVYDYIAFWPISFLPLAIHFIAVQNDKRLYGLKFYSLIFSLFVFVFFPFLHLFKASFLPTYSIATEVNRLNQIKEKDLIFSLDTQGAVLLTSITGKGYVLDIINRPGTIGFPESIEVEIIEPKQILIREVNVDSLLKVAGWEVKLGDQNLWNINIFSLGSILNFQNINLNNVSLSGTGEIYLDETHEFNDFVLNGDFTVYVPSNLPLLVEGSAEVPDDWIEATIGYLSKTNQTYKVKIKVLNNSEVTFEDYEEQQ
tara:strand:+ start:31 stop:888 length:858 start_codon:yes stop_codon:yes gene_type:complete